MPKKTCQKSVEKSGIVTPLTTTSLNNPRVRGKIALHVYDAKDVPA